MYNIIDIIKKKRDGQPLEAEEIQYFIQGYTRGEIPDYQASALAMAIYFQGMDPVETACLALSMAGSGDCLDLSPIHGIKVDKHSTGGVGDKTTLTVGPVVAAAGVPVAKMSGRGLGHTGGTIDKFEAIPGFRVQLSHEQFIEQVNRIQLAVISQSGNLVPADKKLYALRDVTATVDSIPLIASSVMSKKLAAGAEAILLDVKVGDGAFMKTLEQAAELARTMVAIGTHAGRRVVAVLTDMEQPLGRAVGNALEVEEALDLLAGRGPDDLRALTIFLGGIMIFLGGRAGSPSEGEEQARRILASGQALDKFREMVRAQGGEWPDGQPLALPRALVDRPVLAERTGFITAIDTEKLGRTAMLLGAGREQIGDTIDPAAGVVLAKKVGQPVKAGEELAHLYSNRPQRVEAVLDSARSLFHIGDEPSAPRSLILGIITAEKEEFF